MQYRWRGVRGEPASEAKPGVLDLDFVPECFLTSAEVTLASASLPGGEPDEYATSAIIKTTYNHGAVYVT